MVPGVQGRKAVDKEENQRKRAEAKRAKGRKGKETTRKRRQEWLEREARRKEEGVGDGGVQGNHGAAPPPPTQVAGVGDGGVQVAAPSPLSPTQVGGGSQASSRFSFGGGAPPLQHVIAAVHSKAEVNSVFHKLFVFPHSTAISLISYALSKGMVVWANERANPPFLSPDTWTRCQNFLNALIYQWNYQRLQSEASTFEEFLEATKNQKQLFLQTVHNFCMAGLFRVDIELIRVDIESPESMWDLLLGIGWKLRSEGESYIHIHHRLEELQAQWESHRSGEPLQQLEHDLERVEALDVWGWRDLLQLPLCSHVILLWGLGAWVQQLKLLLASDHCFKHFLETQLQIDSILACNMPVNSRRGSLPAAASKLDTALFVEDAQDEQQLVRAWQAVHRELSRLCAQELPVSPSESKLVLQSIHQLTPTLVSTFAKRAQQQQQQQQQKLEEDQKQKLEEEQKQKLEEEQEQKLEEQEQQKLEEQEQEEARLRHDTDIRWEQLDDAVEDSIGGLPLVQLQLEVIYLLDKLKLSLKAQDLLENPTLEFSKLSLSQANSPSLSPSLPPEPKPDPGDLALGPHIREWLESRIDPAEFFKFPSQRECADFLEATLADMHCARSRDFLRGAVARSAEQLARMYNNHMHAGLRDQDADPSTTRARSRVDVPFVVTAVDIADRSITVSQRHVDWLRLVAISHRWEERDGAAAWTVLLDEDPTIRWTARLVGAEAENIKALVPCWVDYVCILEHADVKPLQMQSMAFTYCISRTAICGARLSPETSVPMDYWQRLWCKQEFSLTRLKMTETLRLAVKRWMGDTDHPSITQVPHGALDIVWGATTEFRAQQDEATADDNRWPLAMGFMKSIGYGNATRETIETWAQALVQLSLEEMDELMTRAVELRCWEPPGDVTRACPKWALEYLQHMCCAECSFDEDRVHAGVGCIVSLQGARVPLGTLAQQYTSVTQLFNLCFMRFEPRVQGRALANSMMQRGVGPGPFSRAAEAPDDPVEVEVEQVLVEVEHELSDYSWVVMVLLRGHVVGVCNNAVPANARERVSAACAIELQPTALPGARPPPADDHQVDQLGWMMSQCVPVSSKAVKYPWEPPGAAAKAVLAMVRGGRAAELTEGEWDKFKATARKIGKLQAL